MTKAKLGWPVIFFPAASDRESRENGATELAAIVSQIPDGDDSRVNLRVFNHSTNGGNVPLRQHVPHRDEVDSTRPYYLNLDEVDEDAEDTNLSTVDTSRNEEGVGSLSENLSEGNASMKSQEQKVNYPGDPDTTEKIDTDSQQKLPAGDVNGADDKNNSAAKSNEKDVATKELENGAAGSGVGSESPGKDDAGSAEKSVDASIDEKSPAEKAAVGKDIATENPEQK